MLYPPQVTTRWIRERIRELAAMAGGAFSNLEKEIKEKGMMMKNTDNAPSSNQQGGSDNQQNRNNPHANICKSIDIN